MTFNRGELSANVRLLPRWDADFEVPDVVNFQDLLFAADPFAARLERASRFPASHNLSVFPYPKPEGGLRSMAVLPPAALALFRTAAGRLLPAIQSRAADVVYSSKLITQPPAWTVNPKRAWREMRGRG